MGWRTELIADRRSYFLNPTRFNASLISLSVTSSTMAVAPMAVGRTKCRRPGTTFLSWRMASRIWAIETSVMAGRGPSPAMRSASAFCHARQARRAPVASSAATSMP